MYNTTNKFYSECCHSKSPFTVNSYIVFQPETVGPKIALDYIAIIMGINYATVK